MNPSLLAAFAAIGPGELVLILIIGVFFAFPLFIVGGIFFLTRANRRALRQPTPPPTPDFAPPTPDPAPADPQPEPSTVPPGRVD